MIFKQTDFITAQEEKEIFLLWNVEYPRQLVYERIEELQNYLNNLKDHYHILLKDEEGQVKGWYFDFIREDKRWFATILYSEVQGKGYGSRLLKMAKQKRKELHGWVILEDLKKANGKPYISPIGFYSKNNFTVRKDVQLITEKFSAIKIEWSAESSMRRF